MGTRLGKFQDQAGTRDALRALRRDGPGRLRLAALDALMYLGGEAALDAVDIAAAERLIRIRDRAFEVRTIIERLSVEYREAHAFYFGAQGDGFAWLVARTA